jgi:hypothetical protein
MAKADDDGKGASRALKGSILPSFLPPGQHWAQDDGE